MKQHRIILLISAVFGICFWFIDAFFDFMYFYRGTGSYLEIAISDIPPHEIYIRLMVLALFIAFGFIIGGYIKRRNDQIHKIDHLNRILLSIRNVNQLIAREKDAGRLITRTCRDLIEHRGYYNSWIVLFKNGQHGPVVAEAGLGQAFFPLKEQMEQEIFPHCIEKAKETVGVYTIADPTEICGDCVLTTQYHGRGGFACRLEHSGKVFGVLAASVPPEFLNNKEEKSLFEEISKDIALTLHDINSEIKRREAEKKLRESEEWLSVTLASIGDAVIATDCDGLITFLNNEASRLTGWPSEEVVGRDIREVFHIVNENSREGIENPVTKVLEDGLVVGLANHTVLISRDGHETPIDDSGAPIRNGDGEIIGVVMVFQDITQRRAAEKHIRQSEETYRNLFHNAQIGLFRTRIEDGKLLECNERLAKMFGFEDRDEMIEKYITSDNYVDQDARQKMLDILAEKGAVEGFEAQFLRKDETPIWIRFSAKIYKENGWIEGVLEDIDTIKKAEERLRKSEEQHRNISTLMSDYIYFADFHDERNASIEWYGPKIEEFTGLNSKTLGDLRTGWLSLVHPDDRHTLESNFETVIQKNQSSILEYRLLRADKQIIWVRDYTRPVYSEEAGRVIKVYGAIQNISERKRNEEEIRQSRERIKAFIDAVDDMAYFQGLDGNLTILNNAVEKVTGYGIVEFENNPRLWNEIIHPDDLEEANRFFRENPDGVESYETVYRLQSKKGEWRWIQSRMSASHDKGGKRTGYYCIDRDITEHRNFAEALAKSEATLKSIFRAAPIGIGIVTNRIFGWTNDQMYHITGYKPEELKGRNARMIYPSEEEYERVGRVKHADVRETGIGAIVTKIKKKDGTIIDALLSSGSIDPENMSAGLVFTISDISQQKRAEEALEAEKERLDVTLRSIGDAVIATDTNGTVVLFNKIAEDLTGWNNQDAIGRPLEEVFHIINEKTRERCTSPVAKVLKSNKIIGLANDTVLIAKNGSERIIEDSGAPIRNKYGNIIGVVLVFRDVTEAKRLQDFASRAQRLETAGRIAGQVAHDFNNLLAPLTAYPDLIKMELPPNHAARKFLDDIERSAEQIADINQQLLTLGRRGHYNQEPINVNSVAAQALNQLKPFPETLNVVYSLNDNIMAIRGGTSQIHRLFLNLINNAREAMSDIGTLTIKTENFYVEALSGKYGRVPQGEYVKVAISDTGTGMSPDVMAKIFDPFFTTKASDKRRGSGLGLSVVHAVMEDHNGFIDCESEPGEGSSFYLYFPITREQVKPAPQDEIFGGTEKILVVDDDPLQLEVCVRLLENLGYRAAAIGSGEEAIEFIKDNPQDLLILDMIMPPGIDGAETYRRILDIYPGQKAIMVSGYAQSERVEKALQMGAGEYIKKPLSIRIIAHAVRRELDRRPVE